MTELEAAGLAELIVLLAEEERPLWVAAVTLYGVGDTVTTLWGLSIAGVAEAGPLARPLMDSYGTTAFLALKILTLVAFFAVWAVLRTPGRVAIPLALALTGGAVTVWNLVVILSASGG